MTLRFLGAAAFAALFLAGCAQGGDDEFEPAVVPKTYAFEGKVEPKYVGNWTSSNGASILDLKADGSVSIKTITHSQSGENTSHVEGKWLASDTHLLFEYEDASKAITVLKDSAKLEGSTLTLQQEGGRIKTVYHRK